MLRLGAVACSPRSKGLALEKRIDVLGRKQAPSLRTMERETGFEPATPCLEGRNSTAELLPLGHVLYQLVRVEVGLPFFQERRDSFLEIRMTPALGKALSLQHETIVQ